MNKAKTKQLLLENHINIKKKYGQNFLLDDDILNKIISDSKINKASYVVEIGPGLGFLTKKLSQNACKVLCYEIDAQMIEILNQTFFANVEIIHDDFLKRNLDQDLNIFAKGKKVTIVANLPYYITTAILLKILEETSLVERMVVMMQKEVAQRICGKPKTKDYNALSVLMQYFTNPKILFDVKPSSFYPSPNVDSSVVLIEYKKEKSYQARSLAYFLKFNRNIFLQRRKTLINNLQKAYPYPKENLEELLKGFGLSLSSRAEELDVKTIVELSNLLYDHFIK